MTAIVLTAVLTPLVLIAAFANQWVSKDLTNTVHGDRVGDQLLAGSWLTYMWRVNSQHGNTDAWGSQFALIGVTVVVGGLLVFAVTRGPVTFGRAFFGTWTAVLAATLLGAVARGLVWGGGPTGALAHAGRFTRAVFGPNGPGEQAAIGGFALGFVTALLTALVAVASRRVPRTVPVDVVPADTYVPPEPPPPYYGEPGPSGIGPTLPAPPYWQPAPQPQTEATTRLPRSEPETEATQQVPRVPDEGEETTRFPRPPDDDIE